MKLNGVSQFWQGFRFLRYSLKLIKEVPGLFLWILFPLAIDLLLVVYSLSWGFGQMSAWVAAALGWVSLGSGFFYKLVYYPLYILLGFGFTVVVVYAVFLISTVIASPFNSYIAEKVLMHCEAVETRPFNLVRWASVSAKMMMISLVRAFLFAVLGLVIFIFSFIPGLNILASFAAFMIISFDCADYSFEILEMGLVERFRFFKKNILAFSGSSSMIGLTLLLPGFTLLVLPFAVVGKAFLISELRKVHEPRHST